MWGGAGKIGDILFLPPDSNLSIGHMSVINQSIPVHVPAPIATTRRGRQRDAAGLRGVLKRAAYRAHDADGPVFEPLSHESFGRTGQPAMPHLGTLTDMRVSLVLSGWTCLSCLAEA